MRLVPCGENVVLAKVVHKRAKLVLSESAEDSIPHLKRWKIADVGPDVKHLKRDQYVVFNAAEAGEIPDGEQKYVIVPAKAILAVVEE